MFNQSIFHNNYSVYSEPFEPVFGVSYDVLSTNLSNILTRYDDISRNIDVYNNARSNLTNLTTDRRSDFSNNNLDFTRYKKRFNDGAKEDVEIMLVNQYNMYMAGLITTASIIVFAILIAR